MFVAIDNKDKSIIDLDGEIKNTRNDGRITPEYAMGILSQTNHRVHIKTLVEGIKKEYKTKEQLEPYREFILSCVDGREVIGEAFDYLCEMADLCECREEFDAANNKPKFYSKFDCDNVVIVKSIEELEVLEGENLTVYFDADEVDFGSCDLSKVKALKFREGAEIVLDEAKNLPKDLDVSMCSSVYLHMCDLEGLNLKFREGAKVNLRSCENLPKDLDVSMCSRVTFSYCDLSGVKELKFREGAEVCLGECENLPKDLDVSVCSSVYLHKCDLEGLNLKFREGAVVSLVGAQNLPKELDVSMCSEVGLGKCDLEGLNLKFREGAEVDLYGAQNLPKELDVSMCSDVNLSYCDFSGVKKIKFRNKRQQDESRIDENDFSGEVVYASMFSSMLKILGYDGMGE